MASGRYMPFPPSPSPSAAAAAAAAHSLHLGAAIRSSSSSAPTIADQEKYLSDLLAEYHKLNPFMPVLPQCYRLLSSEILRVTTLLGNASLLDQTGLDLGRELTTGRLVSNGAADMNGWAPAYRSELNQFDLHVQGLVPCSPAPSWPGSCSNSSGLYVKKTIRVDVPVEKYPTFVSQYNFVGRLLGPRGNSLKRVEATTGCRVLIRGRGSIKDPIREEVMRGKPGYEHLNEPLHVLIEAELPVEVVDTCLMKAHEIIEDLLKPVDESQDFFKKQQLRELAMLNGTLRDDGSQMSGSVSPFHNSPGMKRAKTRG